MTLRRQRTGPDDARALVAVDLGAESCRVSLLRWVEGSAADLAGASFSQRAGHGGPEGSSLHWDLPMIEAGVEAGLRRCAEIAVEGIRSIAVDGWAVDYVRLGDDGAESRWAIPSAIAICARRRRRAGCTRGSPGAATCDYGGSAQPDQHAVPARCGPSGGARSGRGLAEPAGVPAVSAGRTEGV